MPQQPDAINLLVTSVKGVSFYDCFMLLCVYTATRANHVKIVKVQQLLFVKGTVTNLLQQWIDMKGFSRTSLKRQKAI